MSQTKRDAILSRMTNVMREPEPWVVEHIQAEFLQLTAFVREGKLESLKEVDGTEQVDVNGQSEPQQSSILSRRGRGPLLRKKDGGSRPPELKDDTAASENGTKQDEADDVKTSDAESVLPRVEQQNKAPDHSGLPEFKSAGPADRIHPVEKLLSLKAFSVGTPVERIMQNICLTKSEAAAKGCSFAARGKALPPPTPTLPRSVTIPPPRPVVKPTTASSVAEEVRQKTVPPPPPRGVKFTPTPLPPGKGAVAPGVKFSTPAKSSTVPPPPVNGAGTLPNFVTSSVSRPPPPPFPQAPSTHSYSNTHPYVPPAPQQQQQHQRSHPTSPTTSSNPYNAGVRLSKPSLTATVGNPYAPPPAHRPRSPPPPMQHHQSYHQQMVGQKRERDDRQPRPPMPEQRTSNQAYSNNNNNNGNRRNNNGGPRNNNNNDDARQRQEENSVFALGVPRNKVFVFDTCALLNINLRCLAQLADASAIIIPFTILGELDGLHKGMKPELKQAAISLRELFLSSDSFRFQKKDEVKLSYQRTEKNNDDSVITCAVYFRDVKNLSPIHLITDDKFLRLKARAEGVSDGSLQDLMSGKFN